MKKVASEVPDAGVVSGGAAHASPGAPPALLSASESDIEAETERMLGQLKLWAQWAADPALQEVISRSCEGLLVEIHRIVTLLDDR